MMEHTDSETITPEDRIEGVLALVTMLFWTAFAVLPVDLCWSSTASAAGIRGVG